MKWTEDRVFKAIKRRYKAPEWACFPHVPDSTGGDYMRISDAIAINLWPSRGMAIHGFEIKVTKRDLKQELRIPQKAEAIAKFCDYWWLVIPKGLANDVWVPDAWGVYEVDSRGMRERHKAEKLDPVPPTKGFVAAVLRCGEKGQEAALRAAVPRSELAERVDQAYKRGLQEQMDGFPERQELNEKIIKQVKEFEEITGIVFTGENTWDIPNGRDLGFAMKVGQALVGAHGRDLSSLLTTLGVVNKRIEEVIRRVKALEKGQADD